MTGANVTAGEYTLPGGAVPIAGGALYGSATFTVVNDALLKGTESATVAVTGATFGYAAGTTTSQVVTLTDDESATLSISTAATVADGPVGSHPAGTVTLTVTGSRANPFDAYAVGSGVAVRLNVSQTGTATDQSDYNYGGTSPVTFSGGAASGATYDLPVTVINDRRVEGPETVDFTLGTPSPIAGTTVALGNVTNSATITDNDPAVLSFTLAADSLAEGDTPHAVLVHLGLVTDYDPSFTGPDESAYAVTGSVALDVPPGTATTGTDYTFAAQTATFAAGSAPRTDQSVSLTVIGDLVHADHVTVRLALTHVGGPATTSADAAPTRSPSRTTTPRRSASRRRRSPS